MNNVLDENPAMCKPCRTIIMNFKLSLLLSLSLSFFCHLFPYTLGPLLPWYHIQRRKLIKF